MKTDASVLYVMLLVLLSLLFVACPEPELCIAFEHDGELKDWIELQVPEADARLTIMGSGQFRGGGYVLDIILKVHRVTQVGDLSIHLDSLHVAFNHVNMDAAYSSGLPEDNRILESERIFKADYTTDVLWESLPRDENGTIKNVQIALSMNGLLRFEGQACAIGPLVAWERKAARYAPVVPDSVTP